MKRRIALFILSSALLGLTACKIDGGGSSSSSKGVFSSSSSSEETHSSSEVRSSSSSNTSSSSSSSSLTSHEGPWTLADGGDITYACPSMESDFFYERVLDFKRLHPEYQGQITQFASLSEADVAYELRKDAEHAPDVFELVDDHISQTAHYDDVLTPFEEEEDLAYMEDLFDDFALDCASLNGKVYGIPYRNDNGYVLSYNKLIVSDEDAKTVEGIVAACKRAGATFNFNLTNSWYAFSPVYAAGGKTYFDEDGKFRAEIAKEEVAEALVAFTKIVKDAGETWRQDDDDTSMVNEKIGAVVKWNNEEAEKASLGQHLGIAPMPSFQANGKTYQLKSFQCCKTLSIRKANAMTPDKLVVAREFAKYMASDEVAELRLAELNQGVSNKAVIAKPELWSSQWLKALSDQQLAGNTIAQVKATDGSFWGPAEMLGMNMARGNLTDVETAMAALTSAQNAMMM